MPRKVQRPKSDDGLTSVRETGKGVLIRPTYPQLPFHGPAPAVPSTSIPSASLKIETRATEGAWQSQDDLLSVFPPPASTIDANRFSSLSTAPRKMIGGPNTRV